MFGTKDRCLLLVLFVANGVIGAQALDSVLQQQIQNIVGQEGILLDLLVPETYLRDGSRVPVPDSVAERTVYWIRKIIREEWIPKDITSRLTGLKEIKQFETRDPTGQAVFRVITDLVVAEYEIDGLRFHLIESGLSLSLRVDLGAGGSSLGLNDLLLRFTRVDPTATERLAWQVKSKPPLSYGWVKAEKPQPGQRGLYYSRWWEDFTFASTDRFFFVSAGEVEETTSPRGCIGCYPDRF